MNQYLETDDQIDRLVDTQQISYSEAADQLGMTLPSAKTVSAQAIIQRNADNQYYSQQFGVGEGTVSIEQQRINAAGAAACRAALNKSNPNLQP